MPGIVEINDVVKEYALGSTTVAALRGVTLSIDKGEFTAIAGPSGSGKTTLLNLIGGMDVATRGEVRIAGEETSRMTDAQLTDLRLRSIGFIFQTFNLINVLDVYANIEFPLLLQGGISAAERKSRIMAMLERVGIAQYVHHKPNELSGGQRQRVAIARALITRPAIVLADEPTANLDSVTGNAIIELMKDLNVNEHTTFIFSTHDPKVIERASRVVRIADGRLAEA